MIGRCRRDRIGRGRAAWPAGRWLAVSMAIAASGHGPAGLAELPTNNDPPRQIRFADIPQAAARREQLIRFIWPAGLPDCRPTVAQDIGLAAAGEHLRGVDAAAVKAVDRLGLTVLGMESLAYLIHPETSSRPARLAIVHAGHSRPGDFIKRDYVDAIHFFLGRGFTVAMMHMPLCGWHQPGPASLPNGSRPACTSHDDIVNLPQHDPSLGPGAGFRPFLEPVVAVLNHRAELGGGDPDVVMIGLSGGGWTTHMAAAIDTRIRLSVPVAGSFPLYLRNGDPGSVGDLEQYFGPLYAENIAADGSGGGVATWLEIYALGGLGSGRRQVMVTAPHDTCCFRGDPGTTVDTFRTVVADRVRTLGQGRWEHRLDTTHRGHMISPQHIDQVVAPIVAELCGAAEE
jgi:hypothetical protein